MQSSKNKNKATPLKIIENGFVIAVSTVSLIMKVTFALKRAIFQLIAKSAESLNKKIDEKFNDSALIKPIKAPLKVIEILADAMGYIIKGADKITQFVLTAPIAPIVDKELCSENGVKFAKFVFTDGVNKRIEELNDKLNLEHSFVKDKIVDPASKMINDGIENINKFDKNHTNLFS